MFLMVQNIDLPLWKLLAYVGHIEILENLICFSVDCTSARLLSAAKTVGI